jgi:hypothetical protein
MRKIADFHDKFKKFKTKAETFHYVDPV